MAANACPSLGSEGLDLPFMGSRPFPVALQSPSSPQATATGSKSPNLPSLPGATTRDESGIEQTASMARRRGTCGPVGCEYAFLDVLIVLSSDINRNRCCLAFPKQCYAG